MSFRLWSSNDVFLDTPQEIWLFLSFWSFHYYICNWEQCSVRHNVCRCATGESWPNIMLACLKPAKCDKAANKPANEECGSTLAYAYFVSFIFFCSFLVSSIFVTFLPSITPSTVFVLFLVSFHFMDEQIFDRTLSYMPK